WKRASDTRRAMNPEVLNMTVPATDNRPTLSDDDVLSIIAEMTKEAGGMLPARDRVKSRAGIGSQRAGRLLETYAQREGIALPARRNGHLRPVPAQAGEAPAARVNGRAEAGDATQIIPRPNTARPAGGHDDQGKQLQPTASAQSEQAGETGRDTTIAQADQAGGAGRTESTAQADRVGETGRTGDTAQADNRAEDRAGQAAPDASPVANRAAEAGETEPGEAAKWSAMLRGA